jgi:putative transposase
MLHPLLLLTRRHVQGGTNWLRDLNAQMLQQAIRDLDSAFGAFFARRARLPRFRSKRRDRPFFRIPQRLRLEDDRLLVLKLGPLRPVLHRPLEGTLKSATFRQDAIAVWYVSLVVHFELPDTALPPPQPERSVGVDLGLKDSAVLSDGERVPAPRHYRRAEQKLTRLQRRLSRCQQGSKKREKVRRLLARQHQRVANQRSDHLHKLSSRLVREHDEVIIEDLNVKALAKTMQSKSVHDADGRCCISSSATRLAGRVSSWLRWALHPLVAALPGLWAD